METVLSLLVAVGGLAVTGWAAIWSAARDRRPPAPVAEPLPRPTAGAVDRVPGLGRHDERRCAF